MKAFIPHIFRRYKPPARAGLLGELPALGPGNRIYAIGDVHGRLDLLKRLYEGIEADDTSRGSMDTTIILLGDLIDRGPESAGVIQWARALSQTRKVRFVSGNHEQMLLQSFYDGNVLQNFLRFGGRETLASYGLDPDEIREMPFERAQEELARAISQEDRAFLSSFETAITSGSYLFVHAGIQPGVPLEEQCGRDCRWIREPFLSHTGNHERYVVHGHSICREVDCRSNRICIDTGAYASGKLTALCLEGTEKRILQTQVDEDRINVLVGVAGEGTLMQAMPGSL